MSASTMALTGVLPLDKAPGMTSHDVVAIVRRLLRQVGLPKSKVGHAGTLDPDATGVLLVCIGSATRLADLLADQGKSYRAEFILGAETTSEDASGKITSEHDASHITQADIEATLSALTGVILQTPPMVSAVHHEGKRLYELARAGLVVERVARPVEIKSIELTRFDNGAPKPTGEVIVSCGKGTYIRTLCADLGAKLGVGGHMGKLRRLSVGVFDLEYCISMDALEPNLEWLESNLISSNDAVKFLPARVLNESETFNILHGRAIDYGEVDNFAESSQFVRLVSENGDLIALAEIDSDTGRLNPKKVLVDANT